MKTIENEPMSELHAAPIVVLHERSGAGFKTKALGVVALILAGGLAYRHLFDSEASVPLKTVETVGPVELRKWQPDMDQCFGGAPMRITAKNTRDNEINIPNFIPLAPDAIPAPGDDVYSIEATVDYRVCIPGMANLGAEPPVVVTTSEITGQVVVEIFQGRGALTMDRPRIDFQYCKAAQHQDDSLDCTIVGGQDSGWTDFTEIFPGVDDTDQLQAELFAFVQVQGNNPKCLQEGFDKIPLANLLLEDVDSQADSSNFDTSSVSVVLYDANGNPTSAWDSTEQQRIFDSLSAELAATTGSGHIIDFDVSCDTSGFGIDKPATALGSEGVLAASDQ